MRRTRLPRLVAVTAAVLAAGTVVTACSSPTDGQGRLPNGPTTGSRSGDFPSGSGPAPAPTGSDDTAPSTPPTTSSPTTVASQPIRTASVTTPDGTSFAVSIWAERNDPTCTGHAHGKPIITYLTAHPCGGLHRLLATTTLGTRAVGLAISDLSFTGTDPAVYKTAGNFVTLAKKDGTGNIDDLMRTGSRLPAGPTSVPSPDVTTAQAQDSGVEIVDAWYLVGPTTSTDPQLTATALALFLQLG